MSDNIGNEYKKIKTAYEYIRKKTDVVPHIAVVLGSGLGEFCECIENPSIIDYHDIPDFPVSTVAGHKGRFVFGHINNIPVAAMQGRVHYYEGYSMQQTVMPIRLLQELGCDILMLTNAAGGINPTFRAGDFMVIRDQISSFVPSPLIGENYPTGTRFPDMSNIYDNKLSLDIVHCAAGLGIPVKEGIYIQLSGPNYESPAEVRMCRMLGADAVGMSTASEAVAAVHCGMKVCGISFISNLACGISPVPLDHKEVGEAAAKAAPMFNKLIKEFICACDK